MTEFAITRLDDPEPWDRQIQETSEQYSAFTVYRNMGPSRNYAKVARELSLSPGTIQSYAHDHNWMDRAGAWDYYQERIFQAELAERTREMARMQLAVARETTDAIMAPIRALQNRLLENPEEVMAELSAQDIGRLLKMSQESAKLIPALMAAERLAAGQPTTISESTERVDVNINDTQRLGEVLEVLRSTGVFDAIIAAGEAGEIVDAEVVEVVDGPAESEANSLPADTA